jgi:hypothetical protein
MIFGNETITQAGSGTQDLEELQIATVDKWVIDSTGTVKTGAWNGSVIGTSYGGAGAINGVLSANGSGVVSAALAGTGVSIASQTISLASITSGFVVGNNTGSGASPQGVSLSSMFDTLGNTQGQIMYRSASSWIPLSTGTVHQVLESGGASANIDWTSTPTFQSFTSTGTATNSITNTTAGSNEMLDILSTNGPDSAQTYIYLGQSKATQKSVIFDFYQGTTGNSYNDSSLAIGFFGETPTADFNLLKGGNLTLGSGTGGGLTVNGDISAAEPQITKATGTGITVNQAGDVRHLVYKTTVTFAGLSAAAHTADLTIATLPAKSKITAFYADVTTGFTGGGETADTISAGIAAGGTTILAAGSAFTTHTWGLADADMGTSMTRAAAIQGGYIPNWTGTQIISVRLSTTTNNTSTLNAGSVTFYIVTDVFP